MWHQQPASCLLHRALLNRSAQAESCLGKAAQAGKPGLAHLLPCGCSQLVASPMPKSSRNSMEPARRMVLVGLPSMWPTLRRQTAEQRRGGSSQSAPPPPHRDDAPCAGPQQSRAPQPAAWPPQPVPHGRTCSSCAAGRPSWGGRRWRRAGPTCCCARWPGPTAHRCWRQRWRPLAGRKGRLSGAAQHAAGCAAAGPGLQGGMVGQRMGRSRGSCRACHPKPACMLCDRCTADTLKGSVSPGCIPAGAAACPPAGAASRRRPGDPTAAAPLLSPAAPCRTLAQVFRVSRIQGGRCRVVGQAV